MLIVCIPGCPSFRFCVAFVCDVCTRARALVCSQVAPEPAGGRAAAHERGGERRSAGQGTTAGEPLGGRWMGERYGRGLGGGAAGAPWRGRDGAAAPAVCHVLLLQQLAWCVLACLACGGFVASIWVLPLRRLRSQETEQETTDELNQLRKNSIIGPNGLLPNGKIPGECPLLLSPIGSGCSGL